MSNPWFRLYTEMVDDEKLRLLAFEDRWHFIAILCCKGKGILDEANPTLVRRKIAVKLGLDLQALDEVARRLAEVELIDAKTLQPLAWDRRQFTSDQDPTRNERKRRYREKQKDSGGNGSGTHEERFGNGSGTHEERTPESESESDTESDTEKTTESCVVKGVVGGSTTDDAPVFFELNSDRMAIAKAQGFSDAAWVRSETAKFIKRNDGKRIRDPDKAWLAWLEAGRKNGIGDAKPFKGRVSSSDEGYVHPGVSI